MSSSKKEQNKSIFTVKKDSQGNILVTQASGENGGEIRGSIMRTNSGDSYMVAGKGIKIMSGSNVGYPKSGQVHIEVSLDDLTNDLKSLISKLGISGGAGERGLTGATGAQGPRGSQGDIGAPGPGITGIVSNTDGTLTISYGDGQTVNTINLKGDPGTDGEDGTDGLNGAIGPQGPQGPPGDGGGFPSGDKIVNTISIFSSPVSHVEDHETSVALSEKNFGRVEFRKEDYQNSSFDITYRWSFIGDFKNKISSASQAESVNFGSSFNPVLQYYQAGNWNTVSEMFAPAQLFDDLDNHIINTSIDITGDFEAFLGSGAFDQTMFRVSYVLSLGSDDDGEPLNATVLLRSSKIDVIYTAP